MRHNVLATAVCTFISPVLLALICTNVVHAQGSTSSLAGVVRDQQGLVVPGASVRVSGTENTFSRSVTTGQDGAFELAGLLPGNYKTMISLQGFTREEIIVAIAVNQRVRPDVA